MTTSGRSSRPDPPRRLERAGARVFAALPLGPQLGREVLAAALATLGERPGRRYRLPRAEGLHTTLFYLGPASGALVEAVEHELAARVPGLTAPALTLTGGGAFPRRGQERVLWIGVREREGDAALAALRAASLAAFEAAGAPAELLAAERGRAFRPHVTVARPRTRRPAPDAFHGLELERPWRPTWLALVESVRGSGPAEYRPLARFELHP